MALIVSRSETMKFGPETVVSRPKTMHSFWESMIFGEGLIVSKKDLMHFDRELIDSNPETVVSGPELMDFGRSR